VLGAGGVLGAAWTAGALAALQDRLPYDLRSADLIVGTSAGSIMAATLRCGVPVDEIVEYQRGSVRPTVPDLAALHQDSGGLPPFPRFRIGSPRLLATSARAPYRIRPWVAASGLLLQGRGQLLPLAELVDALLAQYEVLDEIPATAWPGRGDTWVVAVDYDSGRRVAFGRPGSPDVALADAVVASCSIPGWYEPKVIDGRRYVDGGVCSTTSLDMVAYAGLDEVYVLAPMASMVMDNPLNPATRLERLVRRVITAGLMREIRKVQATGAAVTVLAPGPEDLAAIGANLMNPARRSRVLETSLRTSAVAVLDSGNRYAPDTEAA
jgi:NTE family protein